MKLKNHYYIMRHGEAKSNVKDIVSSWPEKFKNPLTKKGKEKVKETAKVLLEKNIDLIFSSPLLRAKQTSEIVGKKLKLKVKFDKKLKEIGFGTFNSESIEKFVRFFESRIKRINHSTPKGESYSDVSKRMILFLKDTEKKYKGKNILIVSHQAPLFLLEGHIEGLSLRDIIENFPQERMLHKAQLRELN